MFCHKHVITSSFTVSKYYKGVLTEVLTVTKKKKKHRNKNFNKLLIRSISPFCPWAFCIITCIRNGRNFYILCKVILKRKKKLWSFSCKMMSPGLHLHTGIWLALRVYDAITLQCNTMQQTRWLRLLLINNFL